MLHYQENKLLHKQQIVINQSMTKSLEVLKMSSLELSTIVAKELIKNPFLQEENSDEQASNTKEKIYYKNLNSRFSISYKESEKNQANITLREYISQQIELNFREEIDKFIAYFMLDALDNKGYLTLNITDIISQFKISAHKANKVLNILHSFEPTGIFARNIGECITLQLKEKRLFDKTYHLIINNLQLLANGEVSKLAKLTQSGLDDLRSKIKVIKSLNPKPANNFQTEDTQYKIPDIF